MKSSLLAAGFLALTSPVLAADLTVEQILNQYSAVSEEGTYSTQEVEGRVYVGGNLTGSTMTVGERLPSSTGTSLAVNGDTTLSTINLGNGDAYINGNLRSGVERRSGGGTVYVAGSFSGNNNFNMVRANQGDLSANMPEIDFDAVENYSLELAGLTSASYLGGAFNALGNAVASEGTGWNASKVTVYNTSMSALASGNFSTNLASDETLIINVSGTNGGYGLNATGFSSRDISTRILWNFYEATNLSVNTAIYGSVLAPKATVSSFSGSAEGSILGRVLNITNGEIHYQPFSGDLPTFATPSVVPEIGADGAIAAVMLVLGSMAVIAGRRRAA